MSTPSLSRLAILAGALAILSGCASRTSIVGTWRRDSESGGTDWGEASRFVTYNTDGTFHIEIYNGSSPDPMNQLAGRYRFGGGRLTTDISPRPGVSTGPIHADEVVTVSGDTLVGSNDPLPWHRVNYAYHFVDHSLDLVGKWKDKRGAILELKSDGSFAVYGPLARETFGGTVNVDGTFSSGAVGTGGMTSGAGGFGTRGSSKALRLVSGTGKGSYAYDGRFLTLIGSFAPASGDATGKQLMIGPTMVFEAMSGTPRVLRMLGDTKKGTRGSFVREM